jgi:hypothetical protein
MVIGFRGEDERESRELVIILANAGRRESLPKYPNRSGE